MMRVSPGDHNTPGRRPRWCPARHSVLALAIRRRKLRAEPRYRVARAPGSRRLAEIFPWVLSTRLATTSSLWVRSARSGDIPWAFATASLTVFGSTPQMAAAPRKLPTSA